MAKAKKNRDGGQGGGGRGDARISKELRNAIDKIGELAREPLAREVVMAAAGAALAARKDARKAAKKAAREAGDAIGDSAAVAGWVGAAITAAAVEAGRRLLEAYDNSQSDGRRLQAAGRGGGGGGSAKVDRPSKPRKARRRTGKKSAA